MGRVLKKSNRESRSLKRVLRDTRENVILVGEVLLLALIFLGVIVNHVKAVFGK
jgi:hypothetical protein